MNFLIVTGLSGAGKSMAVNALEDIGFFCIDNIPAGLLPRILYLPAGQSGTVPEAALPSMAGMRSVTTALAVSSHGQHHTRCNDTRWSKPVTVQSR